MKVLLWLVRKELLSFMSDPRGALLAILLPVVLGTLMGAVFSPKKGPKSLRLLVAQEDSAQVVTDFVAAIDAHESLEVESVTRAEAERRIGAGKASIALILPEGTAERLRPTALFSGERAEVPLLFDPSQEFEASIAKGLLTQILMERLGKSLADPGLLKTSFRELKAEIEAAPGDGFEGQKDLLRFFDEGERFAERLSQTSSAATGTTASAAGGGLRPPVSFATQAVAGRGGLSGYNHYAHNYAGMLLLFLLFAASSAAQGLLKDRASGVLTRVRVTRTRPWQLLLGMGLSIALTALVSSAVVYAVALIVFGVEVRGPVVGFGLVLLGQALFVGSFAVVLAGLGRSEKQVGGLSTLIILPAGLLGGAMLPSFLFPSWLKLVQPFIPTYWATRGLAAMTWRGQGLMEALLCSGALLGFAVLFYIIGLRRFSWDDSPS